MTFRCPRRKDTVSNASRPVGREALCFYRAVSVGTQWESRGKNAWLSLGKKGFPQKKVLSLVLCVAMLLSVMVMGTGAASFTDQDEFSDNYAEAAEVLTGMGIIQGYDDGSFLPQRNINRAQVATMIYRAATGDVTDSKISQFVGEDLFDDVNADDWFAGYVNYCGNAEYIKGFTPDTFGPYKQVTGYQVLAMILRAVGYDENDEYTGDQWTLRVAATAREQGLLDNLNPDTNLAEPATRELVAQLIFEAIQIDTVHYVPAEGDYAEEGSSLGEQVFDLDVNNSTDKWGRPAVLWTYNTGDEETVIEIDPVTTYTTAVAECDVYEDTGLSGKVDAYVNSNTASVDYFDIDELATKDTIGAQGQLVEVYAYTDVNGNDQERIVVIDTFLAQVTGVTEVKYDANNHMAQKATLKLAIYDGTDTDKYTEVTLTSDTNYTYAVGDMLLVNAYTKGDAVISGDGQYVEIVSAAESFVGAQTKIHSNANYHTVNGTDYPDAFKFIRDDAGTNRTENFNWWQDQYGNLIGVTGITSNYAVLKDMIWIQGTPGYAQATLVYMDGTEATVTVNSIDGTQGNGDFSSWNANNTVPYMNDSATTGAFTGKYAHVSTDSSLNGLYEGYAMYRVDTNSDGSVNLQGMETYTNNTLNIGYQDNVTLKVDGSAILDNGSPITHVNNATKFLVKSDDTYTAYTGTADLPKFNNQTVEVFYDDANGDDVSDYVYIKSYSDFAGGRYVFATSDASYVTAGDNVVTLEGIYVDGVLTEVKTTESLATELKANMGKLYWATWDDVKTSDTYGQLTGINLVDEYMDYDGISLDKIFANYLEDTSELKLVGNTLYVNKDLSYNVTNANDVIYTDAAYEMSLADAIADGSYGIWVVGDQFNDTAVVYVGTRLEETDSINVTAAKDDADKMEITAPTKENADTWTVNIIDKNNNGQVDVTVDMLATSQYAYYTVQNSNGEYLKTDGLFGSEQVQLTDANLILRVSEGDRFTVTVYSECAGECNAESWIIDVTGWDQYANAINTVASRDGKIEMMQDVTGYASVKDAVAHIKTLNHGTAGYMSFNFDTDKFNFSGTTCEYQIYTDTAKALAGDVATYQGMAGNELDTTFVKNGDVLMIEAIDNGGTPWYFAFQIEK